METIPYKISKIETSQFAIFPDNFVLNSNVAIESTSSFNVRDDLSQVRNTFSIKFLQNDKLVLTMEIKCYFDIKPEAFDLIKKEGVIPVNFLRYMSTITVGTARGVISAKTEGSVLNSIVLPPINLVDLIKEDMVLSKK